MNSKNRAIKKYLKGPEGFVTLVTGMSDAVEWHDLPLLKETALAMLEEGDPRTEDKKSWINSWSIKEARKFFKFNGFSFVKNSKEVTDESI